jgi:glutamate synthase (NADPH/NADH) large chain
MENNQKEKGKQQQSMYVPQMESDACGIGMMANLNGKKSFGLINDALSMLTCMEHRGAVGCEPNSGDGAGILIQTPDKLLRRDCREMGFELPEFGSYGVGVLFLPKNKRIQDKCLSLLGFYIVEMGFELLAYRNVKVDNSLVGETARSTEPDIVQVIVAPKERYNINDKENCKTLERKLYVLRKYATHQIHKQIPAAKDLLYFSSFSYKTVLYKGQLTTWQVQSYFLDLQDEACESAIALVHSRFSTNTVPKWKLAQPFRFIAHNGEINTVIGNRNWWSAKEKMLASEVFTDDELQKLYPICGEGHSDSGSFDNVIEFLVLAGRSIPTALMMMVPEAWEEDKVMDEKKRAFYEYHQYMMEPWDGPASLCFTDGVLVGATLDRNGLRPSRYCLTDDNVLILASEAGALPLDQSKIVLKGRLQPGKILIADLEEHRIIGDDELKSVICRRANYKEWIEDNQVTLEDLPAVETADILPKSDAVLLQKQIQFGYTKEDMKVILEPMIIDGKDPIGSMGADVPLAVLSQQSQHLSNYFKQLFAQVTNPPIDPIRERAIMSLFSSLGESRNILKVTAEVCQRVHLEHPVLSNEDIAKLTFLEHNKLKSCIVSTVFEANGDKGTLRKALDRICAEVEEKTLTGCNILILSDRSADKKYAPIPSLLAIGAVHHHLIRKGLRGKTSLVVEAGDVRETHHFATLIGFGANAVNPYLALATLTNLYHKNSFPNKKSLTEVIKTYQKAIGKGLLKIMSKNGISTLQAYQGAQIFELLGLNSDVAKECFYGAVSRIEGIGYDEIAIEAMIRHEAAYPSIPIKQRLEVGGVYQWKRRGEVHLLNPQTIHLLQLSSRKNNYTAYKKYANLINDQQKQALTLRGLLDFKKVDSIPIEEVEPVEKILKRFVSGAMSFGSISHEAHSTLAIAMNRIGAKSNSGEGGEDPIRYVIKENGDSERSATKQVASGRFGVTSHYLTNADEIQIKMAQGAKPGEGGQLPGYKVDNWIARVRHSTPGVGLISPPPHHDIYSIEDLAQLIFDLKNANRAARINVKLVSKAGVGIIASGVAKAHADAILISGHDGGTGASPISSIRHTGLPWELGLAETHQTLVKNKLRDRVTVQTDGQMRTGRDLAIATLLGAEEWGVATAALVVEGCIMMRKCHLNTCPVGIATQDPELRKRFNADPQYLINFFTFLAQDLREIMAELGFRTINEMVGQTQMLKVRENIEHWKYKNLDLSPILYQYPIEGTTHYKTNEQEHGIDNVLDWKMLKVIKHALEFGQSIQVDLQIRNTNRSVGAIISNEISKRYGQEGLAEGAIKFNFKGSAGQSFGAFGAKGLQLKIEGEANDYFGKGLSGARLIIHPDKTAKFVASENMIIGNVAFYGATSGQAYINGKAGERFAVRNSGVEAVVENIGDHGCEYMTGGLVIVLGETGKNFAAGMSGGMAFIYNKDGSFNEKCNPEMVDLDPLSDKDLELLKAKLEKHFQFTKSEVAAVMLENWETESQYFVKVMPRDYKTALAKAAAEVVEVAAIAKTEELVAA